jgi:hypothetical protein
MMMEPDIQFHPDYGLTPVLYLKSKDGDGFTATPEAQDPWDRAKVLLGLDHHSGWRDKEAWGRYERIVVNSILPPKDQQFAWTGPRFTPWFDRKEKRWFVSDESQDRRIALGTKQVGYATKEEAEEVAEDLQENRELNWAVWPF